MKYRYRRDTIALNEHLKLESLGYQIEQKYKLKMQYRIYLDDVRTPVDKESWVVVRNYEQFIAKVNELGLSNISTISLDHDLGDGAMSEYFNNVSPNYQLDYNNINEKTGMDCTKWLINHFYEINPKRSEMTRFDRKSIPFVFPTVYVHSANPIGSANMMGYVNNFLMNEGAPQTCVRVRIEHTMETIVE